MLLATKKTPSNSPNFPALRPRKAALLLEKSKNQIIKHDCATSVVAFPDFADNDRL